MSAKSIHSKQRRGLALVITGPSGVGKGTLIPRLLKRVPGMEYSVSATTRPPRPGEQTGSHYHFMTPEEFNRRAAAGEFLEYAEYSGHQYGTLRSEVEERLAKGAVVVLEIELAGARQVRDAMPEALQVFIAPPSVDELKRRLTSRGTDHQEAQAKRLAAAEKELAAQHEFHHVVVNDQVDRATDELVRLVEDAVKRAD